MKTIRKSLPLFIAVAMVFTHTAISAQTVHASDAPSPYINAQHMSMPNGEDDTNAKSKERTVTAVFADETPTLPNARSIHMSPSDEYATAQAAA
ncbi:MAG: hypothetical protein FWG42_00305 [Clostridiales bacterium]|nr:hypothetical protein [Clostridiales bacterium]